MAFSRHTSRIYLDEYDVRGAMKVLQDHIIDNPDSEKLSYYNGALITLYLIANHEHINTQVDFMNLFNVQLSEHGFID